MPEMLEPLLDHLVLGTPDLDATVDAFAAATGVRPVEGGRHDRWGTRNYLVGLGGTSYLEFLGRDPEADRTVEWPFPFDEERLFTWAIHPDDADSFVATARAAGVDFGPLTQLSRRNANGAELSWRVTKFLYDGVVPFLIDWGDAPHPTTDLPTVELSDFSATHPQADEVQAVLATLFLTLPVEPGPVRLIATLRGPQGLYLCL
ncbi:VOC family protein [Kribbella sp. NPDC026611]|uniref:VOC family protein n=1 Tax=Kribbella sp. NPDC026611 TaxID=3154911 RepID=UPI0033DC996F